jgi:C-terminal processing protease CtpA/Prc
LSKREGLNLTVLSPGEANPRELAISAELKKQPKAITSEAYFRLFDDFYEEENDKHRFQTSGGITIWRMPSFGFDPAEVSGLVARAKNGNSLILDLRGNGGGYVKTMEELVRNTFDKDVQIAEVKSRKKSVASSAKTRGEGAFKGKLIVLVDSESGSASEIFARLVQIEKRGQVLGDISAGAVMQSIQEPHEMGTDSIVMFGVSVTNADVIMSDGKSLEHVGVVPDELIVPTAEDLAAGRDPVLARAVELLGGRLSSQDAGKLFKYYWKKP